MTNWRLKLLQAAEQAGNVTRTCRHFAISRKTFYKWRQRHHAYGAAGLADRNSAPHRSPGATPPDVVSKILYLRQHYHGERNRQGLDNRLITGTPVVEMTSRVRRLLRLGGLLNFYERAA